MPEIGIDEIFLQFLETPAAARCSDALTTLRKERNQTIGFQARPCPLKCDRESIPKPHREFRTSL